MISHSRLSETLHRSGDGERRARSADDSCEDMDIDVGFNGVVLLSGDSRNGPQGSPRRTVASRTE